MSISIRQAVSPAEARGFDTEALRRNFLVTDLFSAGEIRMTYSHVDRTVIGGAVPGAKPLDLAAYKALQRAGLIESTPAKGGG